MESAWISILPFLVVIPVAIITKQVLPGLALGLLTGAYLVEPHLLGGIQKALEYVVVSLQDESNIKIIAFLYIFSGLVGVIRISGGIKGFVEEASERIQTKRGALFLTWISTLGTFSAPNFRIVTVAPIMRALLKKISMSKQELAFVIETTAAPLIVLIPIATASVGYMVSVIELSLNNEGIEADAYQLFIQSIPFNFFSIVMILIGIYLSFFHHSDKPQTDVGGTSKEVKEEDDENDWRDCHPAVSKELPARPWNLVIPLILIIGLTLFLTWWDGSRETNGFFQAFIEADVLNAMVLALIITLIVTLVFLRFQHNKLKEMMTHFIHGGNELMAVILLLAIVWGLATATEDLGFSGFVTTNVNWIPSMLIPPVLFLLGSLVSYFIGSSWGTWGIIMPLAISLGHTSGASLPLVIGAVFASGAFGAFASPLSDNTNTIAKILNLEVIQYARFKLGPALIAVGIATVLYGVATFIFS
ncbi:Na+/H+ antiporter NhaC family protein [Thalassobacillus sp. CUG 92003]|uniref:Na+/H+ antiporter NhaC family protein n=1 Tax=Thalassobacillus sp. CUG 92003 TaxID=2736641 RepID=UPI0015E7A1FD